MKSVDILKIRRVSLRTMVDHPWPPAIQPLFWLDGIQDWVLSDAYEASRAIHKSFGGQE